MELNDEFNEIACIADFKGWRLPVKLRYSRELLKYIVII